jgi:hypothetical protein
LVDPDQGRAYFLLGDLTKLGPVLDDIKRRSHPNAASQQPLGLAVIRHEHTVSVNRQRSTHRLAVIQFHSQVDECEQFFITFRADDVQTARSNEGAEVYPLKLDLSFHDLPNIQGFVDDEIDDGYRSAYGI